MRQTVPHRANDAVSVVSERYVAMTIDGAVKVRKLCNDSIICMRRMFMIVLCLPCKQT